MTLIWGIEGVQVWITGIEQPVEKSDIAGYTPAFVGCAIYDRKSYRKFYRWRAYPMSKGYEIYVTGELGRTEQFAGVTWNLGLEVATAVQRA